MFSKHIFLKHGRSACLLTTMLAISFVAPVASASTKFLSASEVKKAMLNKTITTRRYGFKIKMRYQPNGKVKVSSIVGDVTGTWRARGNQFCTTFKTGPARGTDCVSFQKIGSNRYKSSAGHRLSVSP